MRRSRAMCVAAGVLAFAGTSGVLAVEAIEATASPPTYSLVNVGPFGGEPDITASPRGELYDTTPQGGTLLYKSKDKGATWTQTTTADPSSGDDCVFTDQANKVYECNLAGSESA